MSTRNRPIIFSFLISVIVVVPSLVVLFFTNADDSAKKAATMFVGIVIAYWLK